MPPLGMCSLSQYSDSVSDPICRTTLCRQPLITRTGHWEALTELVDGVRPTPSTGAIGHPCRAGIGELPIETSPKATDVLFVKWRHMVFSRPSLQELPCVRDVNLLASGASAVVEPASCPSIDFRIARLASQERSAKEDEKSKKRTEQHNKQTKQSKQGQTLAKARLYPS